jgi:hypothetical protein
MTPESTFSTITEKEFWRINKKNSIKVGRTKLLRLMGLSINRDLKTHRCREWLYQLGVKPDEFMVKRSSYDKFPTRHSMGFGDDLEFRFTDEAFAFAKLSGLFDES